jgi:nucleotide-sensitive chloride channel 1A
MTDAESVPEGSDSEPEVLSLGDYLGDVVDCSVMTDAMTGAPAMEEDEDVHYTAPHCQLHFGEDRPQGTGTLFVTTRRVVWVSSAEPAKKFAIYFRDISMHAITRDTSNFPFPCVYCQLDADDVIEAQFSQAEVIDAAAADILRDIFDAFSHGAVLNPDEEEEESDGEMFYNEAEAEEGARQADVLAHLESVLTISPGCMGNQEAGQFDDADEGQFDDAEEDPPL